VFSFNCWHIDLMFIARNVWPLCAVVCGVIVTIRVRWISCSGTPGTEKCARNYHPKHERMKSLARINKSSSVRTNVTMKCVRVTIVAIKSNKYYIFWVCVCVCVSVAFFIQHAKRMRPIVICGLPGSHIVPHYLIAGKILLKKKVIEHKMCFDLLYIVCLKHFSFWEEFSQVLP